MKKDRGIMKTAPIKRIGKQDRERRVLLGLVDYYIKTGKPVGSNTLKETEFDELSSATIRNYFAHLEEEGYLSQPHTSGGRIPTDLAFRTYANAYLDTHDVTIDANLFDSVRDFESREIAGFLQESAELLGFHTHCAVFLSAPRFDHDFVIDLKLVSIDIQRCVCILITDFGLIKTEILHLPEKFSTFALKRIESYFKWRLRGLDKPENLEPDEEALAQAFYNEVMLRFIVGYSSFTEEEIYRTGFSRLLGVPEFQDPVLLASSLSLFENVHSMRLLLRECMTLKSLHVWIGNDLSTLSSTPANSAVLAIPYYIHQNAVGAVGILGPTRLPYRTLFAKLRLFSELVSDTLTRTLYKHKISFRQPDRQGFYLKKEEQQLIGQARPKLLEDKR